MIDNPKPNQIAKGRDLNKHNASTNYIWHECPTCHEYRWVVFIKGKPKTNKCFKCCRLGKKLTFTDEHCRRLSLSKIGNKNPQKKFIGEQNSHWRGGRLPRPDGYVQVYLYESDFFYPMRSKNHYVMEHRLVMAKHLNRCLLPWETVHHINGIRNDNRLENLELFPASHKHTGITRMQSYIKQLEQRVKTLEKEHGVVES
jgi:hypothetical protein